jgi:hypothetical protein
MDQIWAPCSSCRRETRHYIHHKIDRAVDDVPRDDYLFLECAGCARVSMGNLYTLGDGEEGAVYYPSPVTRDLPRWFVKMHLGFGPAGSEDLAKLLEEIYAAVRGGQNCLAAMGIRALLEQVMIDKVGDHGTFGKNLDEFCNQGFSSKVQRDSLAAILDAGHAAMHRGYAPSNGELDTALTIAEGIIEAIYVHPEEAARLAGAVPQRTVRPKSTP